MPGVVYKKKGGKVYPPDWSKIGYDDTPKSTLIGFDYALDIKDNWDTSIVTHTERYRDNKVLMYFPKNIDTTNIQTADRMFQASNLESVDIDLSSARTATAVFTDCLNLRDAIVHGLGNPDAPAGTLNNIANMFSNCRSLVEVDLNLTEYSTVLSAVNLFTDCWELKEFIYDGISENIARISTLYNAFTNCYKMEKLTIQDQLCENIGCYAVGSQTNKGCLFNILIGLNAPNGCQATFRKAKIKPYSHFDFNHPTNAQDMFRECIFEKTNNSEMPAIGLYPSSAINYSYFLKDATTKTANTGIASAFNYIGNATGMFDGFTLDPDSSIRKIQYSLNMQNCTSVQNMFSNSNVTEITDINLFNFGSCTNFSNMFYNSLDIDDSTLNKLLLALTTATAYTGSKTLATLGFTDTSVYPQTRFQNLSNWNAFTAAGWSYS